MNTDDPVLGKVLARSAVEGRVMADPGITGKYGSAVINGVHMALTRIRLESGAIVFTAQMMTAQPFPFTVSPGDQVRIIGPDGREVTEYLLGGCMPVTQIRPGDFATIELPIQLSDTTSI